MAWVLSRKKQSGGGTSVPDWSQIGLSSAPSSVTTKFNYSKDVYDNWDPTVTNRAQAFKQNYQLGYFTCDTSNVTNSGQMFLEASALEYVGDLDLTSSTDVFQICKAATGLVCTGTITFKSSLTSAQELFVNCYSLRSTTLSSTSNITNMSGMFNGCHSLVSVTADTSDGLAPTNGSWMFANCESLTSISVDTSNLTNGERMFVFAKSCNPTFVGGLDNLQYAAYMFEQCNGLTTFSYSLPALLYGTCMFQDNTGLTSLSITDLTNTIEINGLCIRCTNLTTATVSGMATSVTNASSMFEGCTSLQSATVGVSAVNFWGLFRGCSSLTDVNVIDTSRTTNMGDMFQNCGALSTQSRDNVLQMCIGATSYTGTKTLAQLGFNNTTFPVSAVTALTHYNDFLTAGWTIGYSA